MTTTSISPSRLTDEELLARVHGLAQREREATATLVAHLAELDERQLYLNEGFSSLFIYCRRALRYSEGATYNRIEAARAGRDYPVIFELLAASEVHLTAVRLLRPHLTSANHRALLERARHKSKREILVLIAEIRPLPDVPSVVRKLPNRAFANPTAELLAGMRVGGNPTVAAREETTHSAAATTERPAALSPLSLDRYKIQITASRAMYERLQELRDLLRHRIPDGDPALILDEALIALLEKVKQQKFASVAKPRAPRTTPCAAKAPRSERGTARAEPRTTGAETTAQRAPTRHIPADVKRAVWTRDLGQCAFRSPNGHRCEERGRLEFHHLEPFAVGGATTTDNIALRCAAHNRHEAVITLGRGVVTRGLGARVVHRGASVRATSRERAQSTHSPTQRVILTRSGTS